MMRNFWYKTALLVVACCLEGAQFPKQLWTLKLRLIFPRDAKLVTNRIVLASPLGLASTIPPNLHIFYQKSLSNEQPVAEPQFSAPEMSSKPCFDKNDSNFRSGTLYLISPIIQGPMVAEHVAADDRWVSLLAASKPMSDNCFCKTYPLKFPFLPCLILACQRIPQFLQLLFSSIASKRPHQCS